MTIHKLIKYIFINIVDFWGKTDNPSSLKNDISLFYYLGYTKQCEHNKKKYHQLRLVYTYL